MDRTDPQTPLHPEPRAAAQHLPATDPPPAPGGVPDVVVAVLTYRRPEDITAALPRLAAQAERASLPARVLVVDNDPDGGARETVSAAARACGGPIGYVHEPTPGIAAARNRALRETASSRFLVFIDDDEIPSAQWLEHLLRLQARTGAAAVAGPVVSEFTAEPDEWVRAGSFFDRRRLPTGTPLDVAATNNLLLDLDQVRRFGLEFDGEFGLSGGSDTLFTRALAAAGGTMLWCDEAVVVDRVPAGRLTRGWVLRRALRSGNSHSRVLLKLSPGGGRKVLLRLRLLAPGGLRLGGGGARYLAGVLARSLPQQAKGLRTAARGAGMASGAFGYVYREYKRD